MFFAIILRSGVANFPAGEGSQSADDDSKYSRARARTFVFLH